MDEERDEIGAGPVGPVQRRKPRANGWTLARRRVFLEELAASCNVGRALAAAGMGSGGVYRLRQRDPLFAEQWQAALTLGYERLEMALLRRAIEAVARPRGCVRVGAGGVAAREGERKGAGGAGGLGPIDMRFWRPAKGGLPRFERGSLPTALPQRG